MAAPHVAGALALMMAQSPGLSYQELIDVLLDSTDKLPSLAGKTISGGRLNVGIALAFLCSNSIKEIKEYFAKKRSLIAQDEAKRGGSAPADLTVVPPRKTPLVPAPFNQLSDEEKKFFGWGSVVQSYEMDGPRPGQKIRIRILDVPWIQGQYLRIEELIDTVSNLVITRKEMAADHFLVTLPAGEDSNLFLKKFGQDATSITQVTQAASLYQVHLSNPQAIETLPKVLKEAATFTMGVSEPDFIIHTLMIPNNPLFKNQWGLSTTMKLLDPTDNIIKTYHGAHVDEAWNIRTEAPSVMVALIDSGITGVHDIGSNLWHNPSYHFDKPGWGNATGIDLHPEDDSIGYGDAYNHTNYSAGIIGATGNDGVGIAGIAWKVQLLNCKVCSYAGQGLVSDEIAGIDFALNHGSKILNCAFGNNNYSYCEYQALERARAAGVIVVAAAGNEGLNNDQFPTYPASYQLDNIVAVAANTGTQELADFSNYGATTVHFTAPGVHIYSTADYWGYDYFGGTSAATAFVSGALAVMREEFPLASAQELITRLLAAVDKVPSSQGKTVIGGALNVAKALASSADIVH